MKKIKLWVISIIILLSLGLVVDGFARSFSSSSSSSSGGRSGGSTVSPSRATPSTPSSTTGSSWGSKPSTAQPQPSSSNTTGSSWGSKPTSTPPTTSTLDQGKKSTWGSNATTVSDSNRAVVMNQQKRSNEKVKTLEAKEFTQRTTVKDWGTSRNTFSQGKSSYTPSTSSVPRDSNTQVIIRNRYYNSSPYYNGWYYSDPFNHNMIFMFSTLWWFHHWNEVDKELYKDDARFKELEKEVEKLKESGIKPDPTYKDPGMDDAVMYSDGYLEAVKDGKITESTPEENESGIMIFSTLVIIISLIVFILTVILIGSILCSKRKG